MTVGEEAAKETPGEFTDRLARLQIFTVEHWKAMVLKFIELRDRQQWEAGCRESAKTMCATCAAGDVPRPHSRLGFGPGSPTSNAKRFS